jgi:hypothetical protein
MEKGYGSCIPYRKLRTLWEEVMDICKSERESWTFKRDTTWRPNTNINNNGGGSSESEDIMSEEDSRKDLTDDSTKWVSPNSNL